MKFRSPLLNLLIIVLAVSPIAFLGIIWHQVPEIVPVHYDIHFKPDKMGHKNVLLFTNGSLSLVSLIVYFLLLNLHRFDPKRKNQESSLSFRRIAIAVVVFITILNFLILLSINNNIKLSPKLLLVLLGLLFAFIGNYMNSLKPNYFAGLRLPWTLSSDYNWKKTHQLAGKLWFWGGITSVLVAVIIPSAYSLIIFLVLIGIMIIIPIIYSYRLFKEEKTNNL